MKTEFEMTREEMDEILQINRETKNLPMLKIGTHISGNEKQEAINSYWKILGSKYGFDWESVEGSSRGELYFKAIPIVQL